MNWTVVGHFDQGEGQQCLVYGDVDGIMSAFNRNTYTSVAVMLQSASGFDAFHDAVAANPALHLDALHESTVMAGDDGASGDLSVAGGGPGPDLQESRCMLSLSRRVMT